jgi:hypothetical protein
MYGGVSPEDSILELIGKIGSKPNNLENIIKHHGHYLHNRVGTILTDSEKKNRIPDNKTDITPGMLVALSKDATNYEFVIFKQPVNVGGIDKAEIIQITKDINGRIINTQIRNVDYTEIDIVNEQIKQSYKPNQKISDDELLETYEIDF